MSIPSWVKIGARCVRADSHKLSRDPDVETDGLPDPVPGVVYTVNWVLPINGTAAIGIAELDQRSAFACDVFRPLVTRTQEQDTEAFLRIANSVDPIVIADLNERDMSDAEAQLNERWMR